MPKQVLVEVVGHMEGRRIPILGDVVLGRISAPGVTAVPNREVSRRHCCFSTSNGKLVVEDLGSANGTWVNGQRTKYSFLNPGDRIALGRTVFEVQLEMEEDEVPTLDGSHGPMRLDTTAALAQTGLSIDANSRLFGRFPQDNEDLDEVARHRDLLHRLCELSRSMATTTDLQALSDQITQSTLDMFPTARRSHVVLAQGDKLTLLATRTRTMEGSEALPVRGGKLPISKSILARAIRQRESISSVDAALDDRFMGQHSVVINNIRAFMCAPLLFQDEVLGAILVDTTVGSQGFTEQDLEMITAVGAQLAVQVKAVELIEDNVQQAKVRTHLSRYLSPELVEQVLDGKVNLALGGELREGAILFSDLVGFTALSERVGPQTLVKVLNLHFTRMVEAVFTEGGSINKFGGDSLLAVWGLTRSDPDDAMAAAKAGLAMQNALHGLNLAAELPLKMGIGINRGPFVAGNLGSSQQMEYTVLGDAVNTAQRVEAQAGSTQVLLSPNAYELVEGFVGGFALPEVKLKGKQKPAALYSLRSASIGEGLWLTSFPAELRDEAGRWYSVLVIKASKNKGPLHFYLQGGAQFQNDTKVHLVLHPPEYPELLKCPAVIRETTAVESQEGEDFKTVWISKVSVESLDLPDCLWKMVEPREGCVPVPRS